VVDGGGLENRPRAGQPLANLADSCGFRLKISRSAFRPDLSRSAVCRHDYCTICCTSGMARASSLSRDVGVALYRVKRFA
jgi:hypothetical protein